MLTALRLSLIFTLFLAPAYAQVTGSISGTVRDQSGAVIPGAKIAIKGMGLQRTVLTGHEGHYQLTAIPPGLYEMGVEHPGFAPQAHQAVAVAINQRIALDFTLRIAEAVQAIEVRPQIPLLEVARTDLSSRVSRETIDALPLNGRNFEDLIALTPGAKPVTGGQRGAEVSIFGERGAAVSFVVDGADNNDPLNGGPLQRFTQDSIREFEVITTGYEAEFGRAQGGTVNISTRSGTNRIGGSAFFFLRDDKLDSSNLEGQEAPKLERRQWGITLGGPLKADRTFLFGSFEVLDEVRGTNIDRSRIPAFILEGLATPSREEDFTVGPETNGFTGLLRVDHVLSEKHRFSLLLNESEEEVGGEISSPIAGTIALPSAARDEERHALTIVWRETWAMGTTRFLETTGKIIDADHGANLDRSERLEPILILLRSGFVQTGAPFAGQNQRLLGGLHFGQRFSFFQPAAGEHQLKIGWDWNRVRLDGFNEVTNDVEYSAAFLSSDAAEIMRERFRRLDFAQSAARFFTLSAGPDDRMDLRMRNHDLAFFVQDAWSLRRDFTLNLGLRYDYATLFREDRNNFAPRLGWSWDIGGRHKTVLKGGWGYFFDRNLLAAAATVPELGGIFTRSIFDVALPRLGFDYTDSLIDLVITSGFPLPGGGRRPPENPAYLPFANALRANPLLLYQLLGIPVSDSSAPPIVTADNVQRLSGLTPPQVIELLERAFPGTDWEFFDVPGGSIVGNRVLSFFPRGPLGLTRDVSRFGETRTPWTRAFNVGIERQLGQEMVLAASFVRRRSRDLLTRRIVNLFDVPAGHPNFGKTTDGGPRINQITYDGLINYDGLVLELRKRFNTRFGMNAAYTLSRARDNLLTGDVGSRFSNNNHPELEYGPSNQSAPHVFVASGLAQLPFGFKLSALAFWRTGSAFNPRGITDQDGDGLVDQRDTSLSRNRFRTRPFFNVDIRVEKNFELREGHHLGILIEAFNLTNRANVRNVNAVSGPSFGIPNNFFNGREIQLGIRYTLGER